MSVALVGPHASMPVDSRGMPVHKPDRSRVLCLRLSKLASHLTAVASPRRRRRGIRLRAAERPLAAGTSGSAIGRISPISSPVRASAVAGPRLCTLG
eukprot:7295043-Prymnesium_polylepis.1